MYFPFFQKEHRIHHHILSASFFALLGMHVLLGIDYMFAYTMGSQETTIVFSKKPIVHTPTITMEIRATKSNSQSGGVRTLTDTEIRNRMIALRTRYLKDLAAKRNALVLAHKKSKVISGEASLPENTLVFSSAPSTPTQNGDTTEVVMSAAKNSGDSTITTSSSERPSQKKTTTEIIKLEASKIVGTPSTSSLRNLADYEKALGGKVADHIMVFVGMSQSEQSLDGDSWYIANIANDAAKYGITPVFLFEPFDETGKQISFTKLKSEEQARNIELLFQKLKNERGISESKLGIIIPFPEINTPAYTKDGFVPEDFPTMMNDFFSAIRKTYPNARGSLLFDSKSYTTGQAWGEGTYTSFQPYISGIRSGYIESIGIQGFPWVSSDGSVKAYDTSVFLPTRIAKEGADTLGVKKVWFNTGTMRKKYRTNTVFVTPEDRSAILSGIMKQALALETSGYDVMINLFAQDKFLLGEGTDWGYIDTSAALSSHESILRSFLSEIQRKGIDMSLFP